MHSFCMVARVINISPLCPGWGPPYRKWIVCHTSSPRTDQAVPYIHNIVLIILISHVCRESVAPVDAPMDYHIHYTVICVWKWRKVLVPDWWRKQIFFSNFSSSNSNRSLTRKIDEKERRKIIFISLFVIRYKNIFEKNELRTVKDLK